MAQTKIPKAQTNVEETESLRAEVVNLRSLIAQMAQQLSARGLLTPEEDLTDVPLEEKPWFIEPGSDAHALLLGLDPDPGSETGWKLSDPTLWGPAARPQFLKDILNQKINELGSGAPVMQSISMSEPHYALPLWVPTY